jgi:hypothetical protein
VFRRLIFAVELRRTKEDDKWKEEATDFHRTLTNARADVSLE